MSVAHQNLAAAVRAARDQAKTILSVLEAQGHETSRSGSLYLALVSMQKVLSTVDPPPPPVSVFVSELEQLVSQCTGKLAPIKPQLEHALEVARR